MDVFQETQAAGLTSEIFSEEFSLSAITTLGGTDWEELRG